MLRVIILKTSVKILEGFSRASYSVHPQAMPAFLFFHEIQPAMPGTRDSRLVLADKLSAGQVIQAVREKNDIKIFTGFEHVFFDLDRIGVTDATVLLHENISDSDITTLAWQATLRAILSSREERWMRAYLYDLCKKELPSDVCKAYFGRTRLTKKHFAELFDIKINTFIDFIQKSRKR